jgi:germination protein M
MQLLELLLTAPQGSGLHSALPVGTRILSARVEDGLCTVDLSSEFERRRFYGISAQCLSLLSIVNTLTVLDAIDRVEFTVEGNLVIQYGQIPIGAPLVRDERCIGPVRTGLGERDATIYLAQAGSRLLLPVPARLTQSGGMPLPELVVRCILQDPGSNGIQSCISPGTVLNAISVRNGTCTVDLSAAYLTEPQNLTASGRVIAASLCSLDGIDRVQLLVDGTIPEGFDRALFGPLVPQEDWFL